MYQWESTTIVAIRVYGRRFRVVELPARCTELQMPRKTFATEEQAEAFIADQYPDAELFSYKDLELEQANRMLHRSAFQERLDRMFFGTGL